MWTDDGFVIRLPEDAEALDTAWLLPAAAELKDLVLRQLGSTSLFAAKFREAAARALLLPRRRPGVRAPLWQQRKRAADLLSVAARYSSFPMLLETYRGVHRLNKDEEGRVKCVACFMCSTACPARCIHIEAEEAPWSDREKYPAKFDIDELRCIYCGMCEEACPVDAIELTHIYDIVGLTRQEMIFDKAKLLQIYDETEKDEPM